MDNIYDLVKFAKNTRYEDIPADVIEGAKILLKDAIAVAVAGTGAEGVDSALKVVRKWGGAPESSVLVFGDNLPTPHAAFVNSVMTHARDYDEVQLDASYIQRFPLCLPFSPLQNPLETSAVRSSYAPLSLQKISLSESAMPSKHRAPTTDGFIPPLSATWPAL